MDSKTTDAYGASATRDRKVDTQVAHRTDPPTLLGELLHPDYSPDHQTSGCVLCERATISVPLKPCCGEVLLGDECDCGPGEFSEVFELPAIHLDLRHAA